MHFRNLLLFLPVLLGIDCSYAQSPAARPVLECRVAEKASDATRNPTAIATIPSTEGPGWVVTGGGCETQFSGHWPPVSFSGPEGRTGWKCIGRDPPNIPLSFTVIARAVYCRVQ